MLMPASYVNCSYAVLCPYADNSQGNDHAAYGVDEPGQLCATGVREDTKAIPAVSPKPPSLSCSLQDPREEIIAVVLP